MLIVGLGNPGDKYYPTRHNIGFWVVDYIYKHADRVKIKWMLAYKGELSEVEIEGKGLMLYKPLTFMNLSGEGVAPLVRDKHISLEELIVVHDDLDLPVAVTRLKFDGGSGGHNGIKSIVNNLGTPNFWRAKIGIGRPHDTTPIPDYVLSPPPDIELPMFRRALEKTYEMVRLFITDGKDRAMQYYNTRDTEGI